MLGALHTSSHLDLQTLQWNKYGYILLLEISNLRYKECKRLTQVVVLNQSIEPRDFH